MGAFLSAPDTSGMPTFPFIDGLTTSISRAVEVPELKVQEAFSLPAFLHGAIPSLLAGGDSVRTISPIEMESAVQVPLSKSNKNRKKNEKKKQKKKMRKQNITPPCSPPSDRCETLKNTETPLALSSAPAAETAPENSGILQSTVAREREVFDKEEVEQDVEVELEVEEWHSCEDESPPKKDSGIVTPECTSDLEKHSSEEGDEVATTAVDNSKAPEKESAVIATESTPDVEKHSGQEGDGVATDTAIDNSEAPEEESGVFTPESTLAVVKKDDIEERKESVPATPVGNPEASKEESGVFTPESTPAVEKDDIEERDESAAPATEIEGCEASSYKPMYFFTFTLADRDD